MKKQSCRHTKQLSAYMDGELSEFGMNRMRRHIACCPVCRSCLERLESAKALMLKMAEIAPSSDFDARFQERLTASTASAGLEPIRPNTGCLGSGILHLLRVFLFTTWRPYALGAAAAGVLAFLILTGDNGNGLGVEEMFLAENLEILQEYDILSDLEFLENLDLIETMKLDL